VLFRSVGLHPLVDAWWDERELESVLPAVDIPVFSIGVWAKLDLHLGGNILGWRAVRGPKWLLVTGAPNAFEACAEFEAVPFHRDVLAPFYDRFLKGLDNGFEKRPPVEVFVGGARRTEAHGTWPPAGAGERAFHLREGAAGHVASLNDGRLDDAQPSEEGETAYDYPRPDWAIGVVKLGVAGPDPLAEILTFTTPPLEAPLSIRGPCEFVVHLSSTRDDADLIVRLVEVPPAGMGRPTVITKGWLRASHRPRAGDEGPPREPRMSHREIAPLRPGEMVEARVPLMHAAYDVAAGSRLRLEVANGDSAFTDIIFTHTYTPDKAGRDTLAHGPRHPSRLLLTTIG
jgi:putative CocE/NonD family hydrolase